MARRTAREAAGTRGRILDQALLVFAERGVEASQLEEIASRAGVTRGALYHHFSGKRDLLQAVMKERWSSTMEPVLHPLRTQRGMDALNEFVERFLRCTDSDATVRALLKISLAGEGLAPVGDGMREKERAWADWLELLERHIGGLRKSRGGARIAAETVLHALWGYAVWSSLFGPLPPNEHAERRLAILHGLNR